MIVKRTTFYFLPHIKVAPLIRMVCLLLTCSFGASATIASELRTFRATYNAEYQGLPVKATGTRELTKSENGSYQLVSKADSMLVKVREMSRFAWQQHGIQPSLYQYERTGLGKNKTRIGQFDWRLMTHLYKGEVSTLTIGTLDKLSYQLQLRLDVADAMTSKSGRSRFDYIIQDKARQRDYRFKLSGEEVLDTPLGKLRTVRLDRLREADGKRATTLWLARDHEFVLVRLQQDDNGRGFELNMTDIKWLSPEPAGND